MKIELTLLATLFVLTSNAQTPIGLVADIIKKLDQSQVTNASARLDAPAWEVEINNNRLIPINIFQKAKQDESIVYLGDIPNRPLSTFRLEKVNEEVKGYIADPLKKEAFVISSKQGIVYIAEEDIHSIVCIEYAAPTVANAQNALNAVPPPSSSVYKLQSYPSSAYVAYLDFDGQVVTQTQWKNGATIIAPAGTFTEDEITQIWSLVSEDYSPFNINITTDTAVFNAAPKTNRMRCIFTPNDEAAPGAGGVAYVNSFSQNNDNPCWVFNSGAKAAGEAASHEIGHTVGLRHDGLTSPASDYYNGHANWCPIMGAGYDRAVVQWSKGEYRYANNKQDDLTIITTQNGFGYKTDDYENTVASTKFITVESTGEVLATSNIGIIEKTLDVDVLKFLAGTGRLNLSAKPFYRDPNLNIKLSLLDEKGTVLIVDTQSLALSATITYTIATAGNYYLAIEGVSDGTSPFSGYSDYGSLGTYTLSGEIPKPSVAAPPEALFDASDRTVCPGTFIKFSDQSSNSPTGWSWSFPGGNPTTSNLREPIVTYNSSGTYDVQLMVFNPYGKDSLIITSFIQIEDAPNSPVAENEQRCGPGLVQLTAKNITGRVDWYGPNLLDSVLTTGSTLTTTVDATSTFYVKQTTIFPVRKVGPVSNSIGTGGYFSANSIRGLIFDVLAPCTLKSVKVYADSAGNRTIQVLNEVGGAVLLSKKVYIPLGESRVTLDFNLPVGTQFHIKLTDSTLHLYRNNAGAKYPYLLDGLIRLTETDASLSGSSNYYYYFYDWEVQKNPGCASMSKKVVATVYPYPTPPTILFTGEVLVVNGAANSNYQWYLDGIAITNRTDDTLLPTTNGAYSVAITDSNECGSTSDIYSFFSTNIEEETFANGMTLYPNPTKDSFTVRFQNQDEPTKIELMDVLGHTVKESNSSTVWISALPKGLYIVKVYGKSGKYIQKVLKE